MFIFYFRNSIFGKLSWTNLNPREMIEKLKFAESYFPVEEMEETFDRVSNHVVSP